MIATRRRATVAWRGAGLSCGGSMTVDIESKLGYRVGVTAVPKHRIATCSARSHLRGDTRDRAGREACEVQIEAR